jgi:rubrerythrin
VTTAGVPTAPSAAGEDNQAALLRTVRRVRATLGDYRCAECGYVVTVRRELDWCPMCGAAAWTRSGDAPGAVATAVARG